MKLVKSHSALVASYTVSYLPATVSLSGSLIM